LSRPENPLPDLSCRAEAAGSVARSREEGFDPPVAPVYPFSYSSEDESREIDLEVVDIIEPDESPSRPLPSAVDPGPASKLDGPPDAKISARRQFGRPSVCASTPAALPPVVSGADCPEATVRTDRYGWKASSTDISPEERRRQQIESEQELRHEARWRRMLASWDKVISHSPSKVEAAVMKGIPDCIRPRAWPLILDLQYDPAQRERVQDIVRRSHPPSCAAIDVDLKRTLPRMVMFSQTGVRDSLRNILHAYAVMDNECGYVQGMAYPAAMLLSYMDEERAFWCFMGLMMMKFQLRRLYANAFEGLTFLNTVWECLLEEKYRRVAQNLKALDIAPGLYTPNWFLTAFMAVQFTPEIRLRIFDRFVAFGCRALVSFALVIIARNREDLARKPVGDCLTILQKPEKCERLKDWRAMMAKFNKVFVSEREYQALFKKANLPLVL
jgi:hypothetical protein